MYYKNCNNNDYLSCRIVVIFFSFKLEWWNVLSNVLEVAFCPCLSVGAAARAWAGGMQMPRVAVVKLESVWVLCTIGRARTANFATSYGCFSFRF